ncbi:MAG TPA: DUF1499 domain-containing protein [Rhizomicrobium sp.]|jgi:hypothetical protein
MRALPALAKTTFAGFIVSLAIGLVAALGTRLGFWSTDFGLLTLFPWCVGVGVLTFVAGMIWILWAMIANDSSGARYGLIGLIGVFAVLYTPVTSFWSSYGQPPLSDATTDTEHPPVFVSLLTQRGDNASSPNYDGNKRMVFDGKTSTVSLIQHKYYGDIHSAAILMSPERLFKRAVSAAYKMGWDVIAIAPDEGRIEATDTSFFFGITDDIVIRVKPAGMGAKLDIRSKARADGDFNGNRNPQRIRAFLKTLAGVP